MKVSEVLWKAANEELWDGEDRGWEDNPYDLEYSCYAIKAVAYGVNTPVMDFIVELGVNSDSVRVFNEFEEGEARQGARYAWLMFASMYAEELEAKGEL